jgi:hypothetical protein
MKQFFTEVLLNLKELAGVNQLEVMMKESNQDKDAFKGKFNFLITELCGISNRFSSMPEDVQQKTIKEAIMTDKEFKNLNVRWLFGLLSERSKIYLMEKAEEERKREDREIRESKGCDVETALHYLNEWKLKQAKIQESLVRPQGKGIGSKLREQFRKPFDQD